MQNGNAHVMYITYHNRSDNIFISWLVKSLLKKCSNYCIFNEMINSFGLAFICLGLGVKVFNIDIVFLWIARLFLFLVKVFATVWSNIYDNN